MIKIDSKILKEAKKKRLDHVIIPVPVTAESVEELAYNVALLRITNNQVTAPTTFLSSYHAVVELWFTISKKGVKNGKSA